MYGTSVPFVWTFCLTDCGAVACREGKWVGGAPALDDDDAGSASASAGALATDLRPLRARACTRNAGVPVSGVTERQAVGVHAGSGCACRRARLPPRTGRLAEGTFAVAGPTCMGQVHSVRAARGVER